MGRNRMSRKRTIRNSAAGRAPESDRLPVAKDSRNASLRVSIVSDGGMFVNAYPHFAAYLLVILCLGQVAFTQNPDSSKRTAAAVSPVFQEASERLGPSSKLVWAEPGSSSLERWTARSLLEIEGIVVSWDPKQLVLLKADASGPTTFPGDLVVGITPGWKSEAYSQAHQSFVGRDFQKMIQQGQAALAQREIPRWQQRVLASDMVEAAMAIDQYAIAAKVFTAIAEEPSPALLFSRIPLPWTDELEKVPPAFAADAASWMDKDSQTIKLLGAAWSLSGPQRLRAVEELKSLTQSKDALIANYASVQLWRLAPPDQILSSELDRWIEVRDSMMLPLQAGPTALLATRLEQIGKAELALGEWLRILTLHSDRVSLVAKAKKRSDTISKGRSARDGVLSR